MFSISRRSVDLHLRVPFVLAALVPMLVSACGELAATEPAPALTSVIGDYSPTVSDANRRQGGIGRTLESGGREVRSRVRCSGTRSR